MWRQENQTKYLSPSKKINSEVDVISGAELSVTNEYHTFESELAEFHEQLNELLTVGFIRPTNTTVSDHPRLERDTKTNTAQGQRQRQTSET